MNHVGAVPQTNILGNLGLSIDQSSGSEKSREKSNELGQEAFLELMITQLKNQDPLSPQDNGEFVAQLAQFSSVEGIDRLNTSFDSFAGSFQSNQALQASSLVGRSVTVPTDRTLIQAGSDVSGSLELQSTSSDVTMKIYDSNGTLVENISLGAQPAGEMLFRWNGAQMEVNGKTLNWQSNNSGGLPAGEYVFDVQATQNGKAVQQTTYLSANVNSVTIGNGQELKLNLAGIGSFSMSDVKQFN